MNKIIQFLLLLLFFGFAKANAQALLQFSSVDSLYAYAEKNSASVRTGNEQALLAKWTRIATVGNTFNLRSPISASVIDNTKLQKSYLPAEAFNGPAGTFREVSLGQQYVTSYAITPQIDIINPSAWARVKSASLNEELTITTNTINRKSLYESIAAAYFNIISIQQQVEATKLNEHSADSIFAIVTNKFNEGIAREQDKNNASINLLNIQDKVAQLNASLQVQYNNIKILCDIAPAVNLAFSENKNNIDVINIASAKSTLIEKQGALQSAYYKSELRSNRLLTYAPTLSFIFNQGWQQNSNVKFFDPKGREFVTQYVGLKLTVPFPFDVNRLSQNYTSKITYNIAKINSEHAALQNEVNNSTLELDYQKALSAYNTAKRVQELKEDNFTKSMHQYEAGILSTENLLLAFADKINAVLTCINAKSNLNYTAQKIKINTTFP